MTLDDLPAGPCDGVVLHWSAGRYLSWFDHYHVCVLGPPRDGAVVLSHPFKNNLRQIQPGQAYAGHTRRRNSFRLGVSAMCMYRGTMAGYGAYPPTPKQIETMCAVTALMVVKYPVLQDHQVLTPALVSHFVDTHYEWAVKDDYYPNRWDWMRETDELERKVHWYAKQVLRARA